MRDSPEVLKKLTMRWVRDQPEEEEKERADVQSAAESEEEKMTE